LKIVYRSELDFYIFGRTIASYPSDYRVEGEEQIPVLRQLGTEMIPEDLVCFDQLSRVRDSQQTGLHFFAQDRKFQSVLIHPEKYVERFAQYKVILTPDVTLSPDMPPSVRIQNIRASRQAGAVWESRGINVVPSVRWSCKNDYEIAFSGISSQSLVAVGTYGATRDKTLYHALLDGLEELVNRVEPVALLLFGAIDQRHKTELGRHTHVRQFLPPTWKNMPPRDFSSNDYDLFTDL